MKFIVASAFVAGLCGGCVQYDHREVDVDSPCHTKAAVAELDFEHMCSVCLGKKRVMCPACIGRGYLVKAFVDVKPTDRAPCPCCHGEGWIACLCKQTTEGAGDDSTRGE